jgi:hypothetical protein
MHAQPVVIYAHAYDQSDIHKHASRYACVHDPARTQPLGMHVQMQLWACMSHGHDLGAYVRDSLCACTTPTSMAVSVWASTQARVTQPLRCSHLACDCAGIFNITSSQHCLRACSLAWPPLENCELFVAWRTAACEAVHAPTFVCVCVCVHAIVLYVLYGLSFGWRGENVFHVSRYQ